MDVKHVAEGQVYDLAVAAVDGMIHVAFTDEDEDDNEFEFTLEAAKELRDALTAAISAAE
jgi:hypothetical protein